MPYSKLLLCRGGPLCPPVRKRLAEGGLNAVRFYGYLKKPRPVNQKDPVYRVMVHQTRREDVYVYLYASPDALFCSFDLRYPDLSGALEEWGDGLDGRGWIKIEDPPPCCQQDCVLPVRVKGREQGTPRWGQYEILENGEWKDFMP